mgnify:CR=1 FL=1
MTIPCGYCDKDIDKVVFCSDKCRKGYSRHGKTMSENRTRTIQMSGNRTKEGRKPDNVSEIRTELSENRTEDAELVRNMDYDHLQNMQKPPLAWRDDKGQCQHKLKMCQLCQ